MVFSSLLFLFRFLPACLALYYVVSLVCVLYRRYRCRKTGTIMPEPGAGLRNLVLFLASLVFYAWGEPVYVVLMLFSTIVDYTHGRLVHRYCEAGERGKAKICVASSMIINLLLLGVFKYADFLIGNLNSVVLIPLFETELPLPALALPIGISFYTFQTMSYTVDIYRGQAKVQRNLISFGAYVALFPQLIAGPIVQYKQIAEQLQARQETVDEFAAGVTRFLCGLGKKVLLANTIGLLWDLIRELPDGERSVLMAWLGISCYAFQIYFDFSGYSDMAIGLGHMFGFSFPENFKYPYQAKSITEFWRRWHITLGSWFREYVYIPLGGNRKGFAKTMRNIAIVWLLTGIWHGAAWNYLLWGVFYGVILILEKLFLLERLKKLPAFLQHLYAIFLIWLGWVLFVFEDLPAGVTYLRSMFGMTGNAFAQPMLLYVLRSYGILLVIVIIGATNLPNALYQRLSTAISAHQAGKTGNMVQIVLSCIFTVGVFLISVAYLVDASYNPFLYLRF